MQNMEHQCDDKKMTLSHEMRQPLDKREVTNTEPASDTACKRAFSIDESMRYYANADKCSTLRLNQRDIGREFTRESQC